MAGDYDRFSRYMEQGARIFYEQLDVPAGCQLLDVACGSGQVALWALHGDQDPTVTITYEQATMDKLLACPSPPRRETKWNVIVGGGHAIWDPIYDLSAGYPIYDFLLANPHP